MAAKREREQPEDLPKRRRRSGWDEDPAETAKPTPATGPIGGGEGTPRRRSGWDDPGDATPTPRQKGGTKWDKPDGGGTPKVRGSRWDSTPTGFATKAGGMTPTPGGSARGSRWDEGPTPSATAASKRNRWDETPKPQSTPGQATPRGGRWDESPAAVGGETPTPMTSNWEATPMTADGGATPQQSQWDSFATPGSTPLGGMMQTPMTGTPMDIKIQRLAAEMEARNRYLTDEELNAMIPTGYEVVPPPANYKPVRAAGQKMTSTPAAGAFGAAASGTDTADGAGDRYDVPTDLGDGMPEVRQEDMGPFQFLLRNFKRPDSELSSTDRKSILILQLLLKIKNGTPGQRKSALRHITTKARQLGAELLFKHLLDLLNVQTLDDNERHLFIKTMDRVMYKLGELVKPHVHQILVVVEPLLMFDDIYAREEGKEVIANLAKAVGLNAIVASVQQDIDHPDDDVRNVTARTFAIIGHTLGIPEILLFIKAVCGSSKWTARHTGTKIVHQLALVAKSTVLPHLEALVQIIAPLLNDEQLRVKTTAAVAIAALAEVVHPYGIECFDPVVKPLWIETMKVRGKCLAAFLRAIGNIIPLMEPRDAAEYTRSIADTVVRQFTTPDEEMKKIILKVVKQCISCEGVTKQFVMEKFFNTFFLSFWMRRVALDKKNNRQLVETTLEIAKKVGAAPVLERIVEDLKDESEVYRKLVMFGVQEVVKTLGVFDVDQRLEELLMDGALSAFQVQLGEDSPAMLHGLVAVCSALGDRVKPYIGQLSGTIQHRMRHNLPKVREQAAEFASRLAPILASCSEWDTMSVLAKQMFENLGDDNPEVLGSVIKALHELCNGLGPDRVDPSIREIVTHLLPILRNRHEKVQQNCIEFVGNLADTAPDKVNPSLWMKICHELLGLIKAPRKAIRRSAINTFGDIALAVGPGEVMATLLDNLSTQERTERICTTIAIAIVADKCQPCVVIPFLLNEYRKPDINVQHGVLKALAFMFQYIGPVAKDYIYAVTPLLEDALMDRDMVHRQIACTVVQHLALSVAGLGVQDALVHLFNFVLPNMFETSIHCISAVVETMEALRVAVGPGLVAQHLYQGMFHPARKVRDAYWKAYNNIYMGAQDSLVPALPPRMVVEATDSATRNSNKYAREALQYIL